MIRSSRWLLLLWFAALLFVHRHLFTGNVEAGRDLFRLFIPESAYLRERLLSGQVPLWTPEVRLGQPFAATMYSQVFYPPRVLLVLLFGPVWGVQASIVFHTGLASLGAWLASRRLGASRWGAVLAGAFGFTPFFSRLACSLHVISSLAWSGFIAAAALDLARRPTLRSAAWLALPLALSLLCGAPEMMIWQGALVLALVASSRKRGAALGFSCLALGWCLAIAAVAALPALEMSATFTRTGDRLAEAYAWSTSPAQLLAMFWPFADEKRSALFDQFFVSSLFVGAIPGMLAVVALRKNAKIAAIAAVGICCALLCLGSHFLVAKAVLALPPFSLFRYPVKYVFGLAFCVALLSGQGLRRIAVWARRMRKVRSRALPVAIALGIGLLSLPLLQALAALAPWREGMKSGALWFGLCGVALLLAFALLSGGGKGPARVRAGALALALLEVVIAQAAMGKVGIVPPQSLSTPGMLAAAIRREPHQRLSVGGLEDEADSGEGPHSHQFLLDGRENLIALWPLGESLPMVEGYGFREPWRLSEAIEGNPRAAYDLLGVSHFVRHGPAPFQDLEPMNGSGWSRAFRSRTAFPRAWVVHRADVVNDATALEAVRTGSSDLRKSVLLADGHGLSEADCQSTVRLEEASPESSQLQVEACTAGYVVLADTFYPGWIAHVNGAEQPIRRADFLLRAVEVPKGSSLVRMEYRPRSVLVGGWLSALGVVGLLFALRPLKHRRSPHPPL